MRRFSIDREGLELEGKLDGEVRERKYKIKKCKPRE